MGKDIPRDKKLYYGWVVVAASFVIFTIAFGIQNTFGVFFKPLQETFGWSRATTASAMTIHLAVFGLCMVPVGWAIDHVNTRGLYSFGAVLVGGALVLASRISEPWQLYLIYGLPLAMGISICGPTILTLVSRWFTGKRGMALGMTAAGAGFGMMVWAPLANALIDAYGWRNSFIILGIAAGIVLLGCARFMRTAPRLAEPDRSVSAAGQGGQANGALPFRGMTFTQAIRSRDMLLLVMVQGFAMLTMRTVTVHIVPYAIDTGISPSMAALAMGVIGGFGTLGRLVMGFFQDKIGARRAIMLCLGVQGIAMLALPFIRWDFLFFIFAVVFGFTWGGDVPQLPVLAAQCFGLATLTVTYGLVSSAGNFAGSIGPAVAGSIFDFTGSYTVIFLGAAAGLFVAVFAVAKLRLHERGDGR